MFWMQSASLPRYPFLRPPSLLLLCTSPLCHHISPVSPLFFSRVCSFLNSCAFLWVSIGIYFVLNYFCPSSVQLLSFLPASPHVSFSLYRCCIDNSENWFFNSDVDRQHTYLGCVIWFSFRILRSLLVFSKIWIPKIKLLKSVFRLLWLNGTCKKFGS